jgi:hypothetical protein
MKRLVSVTAIVMVLGFAAIAHADLINNGGGLIYDTVQKITWYQGPANMTWNDAMTWASNLNVGGVTGWQLPSAPYATAVLDSYGLPAGPNDHGQMGYLWYDELGNTEGTLTKWGPFDPTLWTTTHYWTSDGPLYAHLSTLAEVFNMGGGNVGDDGTVAANTAFAVYNGDVGSSGLISPSAVPIPGAFLLFAPALAGFGAIRRRLKK